MLDLRSETDYDVKRLVEDLKDEEKNKIQFSFTTKLLNIINDEKYAIYDSYVVAVFKLPAAYGSVDKYVECYEIINKTYIEMLADDRIQCLIGDFRKIFIQSDNLSDMRIIDIIVWKIGEDKKK
jgi:hypothetical protein